jgi:hypothetical protein
MPTTNCHKQIVIPKYVPIDHLVDVTKMRNNINPTIDEKIDNPTMMYGRLRKLNEKLTM